MPLREQPDAGFGTLFGAISAPPALADVLPLVRSWRPELVVNDAGEFAAPIAAAVIGVPHVTHGFGALLPEVRVASAGQEVAPLWRAQGLEPRPCGGVYDHLYLDIYPPSLHAPGSDLPGARQLLRPVAYAGAASEDVRTDISDRTGRPLVYLTFGTVFHDSDAFRAALIGIRDLGVGLVATVGPGGDPTLFGSQPPRVVIERYIPQTALLPLCDVVASHAGSGTVLGALALGIPQLCLPQAADQFLNAEAVADAVGRLHDDTRFRAQARRVADEIASMPSPDAVAPVFEALV